jgi:hypothetical protein
MTNDAYTMHMGSKHLRSVVLAEPGRNLVFYVHLAKSGGNNSLVPVYILLAFYTASFGA